MNNKLKPVVIILLALVFLTTTGMVAASPATTKASPLYPIKKAIEAMTLAFAAPEDKAAVQADLVEARVTELNALKLKIDILEKNQELDKAKQLQDAATATELAAKQTAAQAKVDAQLITDEAKKTEVLGRLTSSEKDISNGDGEGENIEAPEPVETPEPKETPKPKEVENKDNTSNSENKNGNGSGNN